MLVPAVMVVMSLVYALAAYLRGRAVRQRLRAALFLRAYFAYSGLAEADSNTRTTIGGTDVTISSFSCTISTCNIVLAIVGLP